jgi:maltose O-acetyltransferase
MGSQYPIPFLWRFLDKFSLFDYLAILIIKRAQRRRILNYLADPNMRIDPSVVLGDIYFQGNIIIGEGTYMNSGQIFSGPNSLVCIGKFCAIGYNVHIKSQSHDINQPTPINFSESHRHVEANIIIGDHVWIGDNVFIRHGVTIGDHAIIGANSVVLKDVAPNTIAAGVPAKLIRTISK